MPAAATRSKGTTFQIGDGVTPTEGFLAVGRVFSVGEVKRTRETIDITSHDSPGDFKEFVGGMRDAGTVQVQYRFAPSEAGQAALTAADDGNVHNFRIVYPAPVNKRWAFAGIVTELSAGEAPVDGVLNGTATIKISGLPVLEAAP